MGPINKPLSLTSSSSSTQINKSNYTSGVSTVNQLIPLRSSSTIKLAGAFPTPLPRATAPRLVAAGNNIIFYYVNINNYNISYNININNINQFNIHKERLQIIVAKIIFN